MDKHSEGLGFVRKELFNRGSKKELEDTLNECKVNTQTGVVRITKALEDQVNRSRTREDDLGTQSTYFIYLNLRNVGFRV